MPFLVAGAVFRGLTMMVDRLAGARAVGIDLLLVFVVCYPAYFVDEILVARWYLGTGDGCKAEVQGKSATSPNIGHTVWLVVKVVVRCAGWLIPVMAVLLVEYILLDVVLKPGHAGTSSELRKMLHIGLLRADLVLYAGVCSRYSFVFPLYAYHAVWQSDAFQDGVRLAKRHWRVMWSCAIGVSAILFVMHSVAKYGLQVTHAPRSMDRGVQVLEIVLTALITGYFTVFKTELMRQATASQSSA